MIEKSHSGTPSRREYTPPFPCDEYIAWRGRGLRQKINLLPKLPLSRRCTQRAVLSAMERGGQWAMYSSPIARGEVPQEIVK